MEMRKEEGDTELLRITGGRGVLLESGEIGNLHPLLLTRGIGIEKNPSQELQGEDKTAYSLKILIRTTGDPEGDHPLLKEVEGAEMILHPTEDQINLLQEGEGDLRSPQGDMRTSRVPHPIRKEEVKLEIPTKPGTGSIMEIRGTAALNPI